MTTIAPGKTIHGGLGLFLQIIVDGQGDRGGGF